MKLRIKSNTWDNIAIFAGGRKFGDIAPGAPITATWKLAELFMKEFIPSGSRIVWPSGETTVCGEDSRAVIHDRLVEQLAANRPLGCIFTAIITH